jgi:hypothetical protein
MIQENALIGSPISMSLIVVDVESDNQSPANGSMVCFGAVLVRDTQQNFLRSNKTYLRSMEPRGAGNKLALAGRQHRQFDEPKEAMRRFAEWLQHRQLRQANLHQRQSSF